MDLLSRVFFFSEFALLRAFLSAQKSTQGPTEPLCASLVLCIVSSIAQACYNDSFIYVIVISRQEIEIGTGLALNILFIFRLVNHTNGPFMDFCIYSIGNGKLISIALPTARSWFEVIFYNFFLQNIHFNSGFTKCLSWCL